MDAIQYVLGNLHWFVVLIGALVFFHELGHFAVAKACGIKVLRFSLGFGPRLLAFTYGETEYSISLLPLGGYVKMLGEGTEADEIDAGEQHRAFANTALWQRTLVVLAGPVANFILSTVIYLCMFVGPHTFGDNKLGVVTVGDPAWQAGIRPGDRIVAVFGKPVIRWEDLRDAIIAHPNEDFSLTYKRADKLYDTTLKTQSRAEENAFQEQESRGKIGVSLMYLLPQVAVVDPTSPAAQAGVQTGDTIEAVDGQPVQAWYEVHDLLAAKGMGAAVQLRLRRAGASHEATVTPATPVPGLPADLLTSADVSGGYTGLTCRNTLVTAVDADTPAAKAGLQPGDRLLSIGITAPNGPTTTRAVGVWEVDLATFGVDARSELTLTWQRGRSIQQQTLHLLAQTHRDDLKNQQTTYVLGAHNDPGTTDQFTYQRPVGLVEALGESLHQVGADMTLIATGVRKMAQGALPMSSMGGPIMLFVIAEHSAKQGMMQFSHTLAMVSVNLGMLNLLPVPMLDGGHLLFFLIEAITRRPPSIKMREYANALGLALVLGLMVMVFKNDLGRFIFN
jgi:regulator of sigma E protease